MPNPLCLFVCLFLFFLLPPAKRSSRTRFPPPLPSLLSLCPSSPPPSVPKVGGTLRDSHFVCRLHHAKIAKKKKEKKEFFFSLFFPLPPFLPPHSLPTPFTNVHSTERTGKPRLKRARLRRKRNIGKAVYESVRERNNNPNKKHSSRPPTGEGHGASTADLWTRGCCHTPSKGVRGTFLFEINNFNIQNGNGIMKATECFPKRKYF